MGAEVVPSVAATQLLRVREGFVLHQALHAVAKLGVADLVEDGLHRTSELAAELKVNESALYRVLRRLASQTIFEETGPRAFRNTELSDYLRTGVPGSLRPLFIFWGSEFYYPCFGEILYIAGCAASWPIKIACSNEPESAGFWAASWKCGRPWSRVTFSAESLPAAEPIL